MNGGRRQVTRETGMHQQYTTMTSARESLGSLVFARPPSTYQARSLSLPKASIIAKPIFPLSSTKQPDPPLLSIGTA